MAPHQSKFFQFTRAKHNYCQNRRCLITDGAKYLADEAGAYWLLDAAAAYLLELGTSDWFVLMRLVVTESQAVLSLEDGNGGVRASQHIQFTDFPLLEQMLYACWNSDHWVLMPTLRYYFNLLSI
jgi:hypothetical protein